MKALSHDLEQRIVEFAADHHAPPLISYAVFQRGHSVQAGTLKNGEAWLEGDQDLPLYRVASLTKSFTAAAVLRLRDSGRLALDHPASRYVPELDGWSVAPTLRELLTMTAGLPTDNPWADALQESSIEDLRQRLADGPPAIQLPKGTFEYSNLGYAILGLVIAEVAGAEYDEVLERWFLSPLHMDSSTFRPHPNDPRLVAGHSRANESWVPVAQVGHGAFSPIGGLVSSATDIAQWASFLSAGFAASSPDRDRILSHQSIRQMQTIQVVGRSLPFQSLTAGRSPVAIGYGFGLRLHAHGGAGTFAGHAGGYPGFGSHVWWHPMTGVGVVILANTTYLPVQELGQPVVEQAVFREIETGPSALSPQLSRARVDVDRLIDQWSDEVALETLSHNLRDKGSLAPIRSAVSGLQERHGPLGPAFNIEADGPGHVSWRRTGEGAVVKVVALLSPELLPKVQHLQVDVIPDLDLVRQRIITRLVGAMDGVSQTWPTDVEISPSFVGTKALAVASLLYGPVSLHEVTSNSEREVSALLVSEKAQRLLLTVAFGRDHLVQAIDIVRTQNLPVEGL